MPFFQLVDEPKLFPGFCLLCHNPLGPIVDTGVDLDGLDLGRVYVCDGCIADMAKLRGWVTPEDATILADDNIRLNTENAMLPNLIREAATKIAAIADHTVYELLPHIASVDPAIPALFEDSTAVAAEADREPLSVGDDKRTRRFRRP